MTNADRLFTLVTYVIENAGTPEFLTAGGTPVLPADVANSVDAGDMEPGDGVLRLTGTVTKGAKTLKVRNLTIDAARYTREDTSILVDPSTNTITVTVAEFKKGRNPVERTIDANSASVQTLLSIFAPRPATK